MDISDINHLADVHNAEQFQARTMSDYHHRPDFSAAVSGVLTGVSFVAAITGATRLAATPIPRPGAAAPAIRDYYSGSAAAVRFSVTGQAVSIASLLVFTRAAARLAQPGSGVKRGVLIGSGIASAALLTASAATHVSLSVPAGRDDEAVLRSARRVFVLGGPVHGVTYGVFTGVLALLGRRAGLWGRAGLGIGVASAVAGVLSPSYFKWENAGWLIPIGRFSGYALGALAGVRMSRRASN
jgi:hypothetical protein